MGRIAFIVCLGLGCGSGQESTAALEFYPQCPAELECRLYGNCELGAPEVMACHELKCGSTATDVACMTQQCGSQLSHCFFGAHTGELACAGIWKCYGDCKDDNSCLETCRMEALETAKTLFIEAEMCTDQYVFTQCTRGDASCDFNAAISCNSSLVACLDDHSLKPDPAVQAYCKTDPSPAKCVAHNLRILAACPTEDATEWSTYLTCLKAGSTCPEPTLSGVCRELEALLPQG